MPFIAKLNVDRAHQVWCWLHSPAKLHAATCQLSCLRNCSNCSISRLDREIGLGVLSIESWSLGMAFKSVAQFVDRHLKVGRESVTDRFAGPRSSAACCVFLASIDAIFRRSQAPTCPPSWCQRRTRLGTKPKSPKPGKNICFSFRWRQI
jgi:hypothetical protein